MDVLRHVLFFDLTAEALPLIKECIAHVRDVPWARNPSPPTTSAHPTPTKSTSLSVLRNYSFVLIQAKL